MFWLLIGLAVLVIGAAAGVFSLSPYQPPSDWFLTEWLLQAWLDDPAQVLVAPSVVVLSSAVLQTIASATSLDPALRVLNLSIVDRGGFAPTWWQWLLRLIGILLSWATLGLGFSLAWVSRYGRSLEDLVSSTALVLEEDD